MYEIEINRGITPIYLYIYIPDFSKHPRIKGRLGYQLDDEPNR